MPKSTEKPLPEFRKPPINEVAIAVSFGAIEKWRSPHAGLFWSRINREYPQTEVHPPLPSQIENLDEGARFRNPEIVVQLADPESSRFWFLSDTGERLIQIQRDKFVINWRQKTGDEVYPRYETSLKPFFKAEWTRFCTFLREQSLGIPLIQQCEITYVNDLARGVQWQTFEEAMSLFAPLWKDGSDRFLPPPESLNLAAAFRMPHNRGRLHVNLRHAQRLRDQAEIVQLTLIARGHPDDSSMQAIETWLDEGHDWIVRGFADLTSPKAHATWERVR